MSEVSECCCLSAIGSTRIAVERMAAVFEERPRPAIPALGSLPQVGPYATKKDRPKGGLRDALMELAIRPR